MNENVKKIFYYLGIIVALYILLRYVLPIILKMLGFVISAVFSIFVWAVIGLAVLFLIFYIIKMAKK